MTLRFVVIFIILTNNVNCAHKLPDIYQIFIKIKHTSKKISLQWFDIYFNCF